VPAEVTACESTFGNLVAIEVDDSEKITLGTTTPDVDGFNSRYANATVNESAEPTVEVQPKVIVAAVVLSAKSVVAAPFVTVVVKPATPADDGTVERTPKPNAATVTSAMRLKVVFVDICFLSIVDLRTIRSSA
jgi:hypothetical protein